MATNPNVMVKFMGPCVLEPGQSTEFKIKIIDGDKPFRARTLAASALIAQNFRFDHLRLNDEIIIKADGHRHDSPQGSMADGPQFIAENGSPLDLQSHTKMKTATLGDEIKVKVTNVSAKMSLFA